MQEDVIKAKNEKSLKISINSCCYSPDGKLIVGGCNDGSV
jgi:hypothetical protein